MMPPCTIASTPAMLRVYADRCAPRVGDVLFFPAALRYHFLPTASTPERRGNGAEHTFSCRCRYARVRCQSWK